MNSTELQNYRLSALHWAKELGYTEANLVSLKGGNNNHVFRCGDSKKNPYVIKTFRRMLEGDRDRMQSEINFLKYTAKVAPAFAPRLINIDKERRCIVMEHIDGFSFSNGVSPKVAAVEIAMEFIRLLNIDRKLAMQYIDMDAAEGFHKLSQHLTNIECRLSNMNYGHLPSEIRLYANTLIEDLERKLEKVRNCLISKLESGLVADSIDQLDRCVSPSDFGFHNAKWTNQGIRFFDFEFAGWDDPAKMAVDFVLQPRVPVRMSPNSMVEVLPVSQREEVYNRIKAILPVLRIKWVCIILGILDHSKLETILRINKDHEPLTLIKERLNKASEYLQFNRWEERS